MGLLPRLIGLRSYVIALVLVSAVPIALFAGWLLVYVWQRERDELRVTHEAQVRALAAIVGNEVDSGLRRLALLARPLAERETDLDAFAANAASYLAVSPDWANVALIRMPDRQQLVNLAVEPGEALPRSPAREQYERVVATRRPTVSDLFVGRVTGRWTADLVMPVERNGEVPYILVASLNLAHVEQTLRAQTASTNGLVSVVDANNLIVARSLDGERYRGGRPSPELLAARRGVPGGWGITTTIEGLQVFTAWTAVPGTPWWIAWGVPAESVQSRLLRSLGSLGAALLVALVLSGGLALLFTEHVRKRIAAASAAALEVAEGREPLFATSRVVELQRLSGALVDAGERVAREAEERARAEAERNRLLAEAQAARARAESESRTKDEFLAMLGHELRNPLAAIANAVRVLERVDSAHPAWRHALEVIERQARQQGRLLDDLLDVARVITGKITLERAPLDLAECVRRALAAVRATGRAQQHALEADLHPVWVNGDAARLEQVCTNLVANALKYTPPGGTIRVTAARDGDAAILRVDDTGIGIDPALLPRIFDLFVQGEQGLHRAAGGLGIGLTLVRRLVELHGGAVDASSAGAERGASFVVRLPAIAQPALASAAGGEVRTVARRRILVVEDNDDARETLRVLLAAEGHDVCACADGAAALEALAAFTPEVAIVDIGLPEMDGYAVARALRERLGAGVRLIALTGYGLADDRRRAADAGFDAHLVKPAEHASLAAAIAGAAPQEAGLAA